MYVISKNGKILKNAHYAKDFKRCSIGQKKETAKVDVAPQPIKKNPGRPREVQPQPSGTIKGRADDKREGSEDSQTFSTEEARRERREPPPQRLPGDENREMEERVH